MEPEKTEQFARFARHYDRFMWHFVDYRGWVDYVEAIFRHYRLIPHTLLDVACGTGIPTILLARRGYRLTGVDRSAAMLAVLAAGRGELPITTVQADMRNFTVEFPHDAAISLYDSVNYLLTEADLVSCFRCVRQALRPGGLFAFDMNTIYGLAEFWGTRTTTRDVGPVRSVWENRWDARERISTLRLIFWEEVEAGKPGPRFEEVHQERGYSEAELRRALAAAGFGRVDIYQHGGFTPPGPATMRIMVVAQS